MGMGSRIRSRLVMVWFAFRWILSVTFSQVFSFRMQFLIIPCPAPSQLELAGADKLQCSCPPCILFPSSFHFFVCRDPKVTTRRTPVGQEKNLLVGRS
ncbi:hypothetical protein Y1Q_0005338 [Alligator mississippiensis]|uniref:Uncharacterized protein n=1 Tax=Alligator mississippiensis TaxID=8496 RepID=A0A151MVI8_ALLMI|nr:hypothetical protein Y1Q_0005338 [Alligator mississippiensis]